MRVARVGVFVRVRLVVAALLVTALAVVGLPGGMHPAAATGGGQEWAPGRVNRTPVGGAPVEAPVREPVRVGEALERRTATSRTFVLSDGSFEAELFAAPVHYRDARGSWQPVRTELVAQPRGGWRNAGNDVVVSLPPDLASGSVNVAVAGGGVEFALDGARGAAGSASGVTVSYEQALDGVTVDYTLTAGGVKEALSLTDVSAGSVFEFAVATTPGWGLREDPEGGVAVVDAAGVARLRFAAPFMIDAAGVYSDRVHLELVDSLLGGQRLRLRADEGWLAAPERAWPVVVDPTVEKVGADTGCTIKNGDAESTNFCAQTSLNVGYDGTRVARGLQFFDVAGMFDEPVTVRNAEYRAYQQGQTVGTASAGVALHRVTKYWSTAATWLRRWSQANWDTPGGDFPASKEWENSVGGTAGWEAWQATQVVGDWLDGRLDNYGFLLKAVDETTANGFNFVSTNHSDASLWPRLLVRYEPLIGVREPFRYERFDLSDRRQIAVNLASGNLALSETDVRVAGTGLDLAIERFYNSRHPWTRAVGANWSVWPEAATRLYIQSDGSAAFYRDWLLLFARTLDGSYVSPPAANATLNKNADGSFTLSFHDSGERYEFSSGGYLTARVDRNGNALRYGYDTSNRLASITDTQGRVTTYGYGADGLLEVITDPGGREHRYARADGKHLSSYTDPAGAVTSYAYSGDHLTGITASDGTRTQVSYDNRGRVSTVTRVTDNSTGAGPTTRFDYYTDCTQADPANTAAPCTTVTDPNAHVTTHYHDQQGRVTKVVDALGHQRSTSYTSNGNVATYTKASGGTPVTNSYSTDGRYNLMSSQLPTGATSSFEYNHATHRYHPTVYRTPQGNSLTYDYDSAGNLAGVSDSTAQAGRYSLTYNGDGTVATATDPNGNTTSFGYDSAGNRTSVTPPAPLGQTLIEYDGLSRVTAVTDGKAQRRAYAYDVFDRVVRVSFADGSVVSFGYDARGNRTTRTDASGTTSTTYNALNRVTDEAFPVGGTTHAYGYDPAGNLTSFSDVGGTLTYGYNPVNLLVELVEPDGAKTTFEYDVDNNRRFTRYPNGVVQEATYDASDRVKTITGSLGLLTLTSFSYTYSNGAGADTVLRHSVTDKDNHTTSYGYDELDRVTSAVTRDPLGTVTTSYGYAYDPASNRTSETVNATTTVAAFNAANQLCWTKTDTTAGACATPPSGATIYSYDANGNQTASSTGQQLAYNAKDQTTAMTPPGGTSLSAQYAGASQFERVQAGDDAFTNSLLGVASRRTGTDTRHFFTRDATGGLVSRRIGAYRNYYLFDGLGSVVALTNSDGTVNRRYTYDPYGKTSSDYSGFDSNPWRYTGEYEDTTGLYKIGHRYYQPDLGRWTQPDPLSPRINPTQPPEAHPYTYVGCNPINYTDPSGAISVECGFALVSAAATVVGAVAFAPVTFPTAAAAAAYYGVSLIGAVSSGAGIGFACF